MPLVRISLLEGRAESEKVKIADGVHRALVETMDVAEHDRFQLVEELPREGLVFARQFERTMRSDALIVIQITLNRGRTPEMKQRFFSRLAELLGEAINLRPEDLFIGLVEVDPDNWFVL